MKTSFRFIHFQKVVDTGKTSVWECLNNNSDAVLGEVRWYAPWCQYVFTPINSFYSVGCLADMQSFIVGLEQERKLRSWEVVKSEHDGTI